MAKKVMVVDDDASAVKFLSVLLEENGYQPVTAADGQEGLEKLKQNDVALIVLDVMMPHKTGLVLFKQIKKDARLKDVPVLMLTGVAASLEDIEAHQQEPDLRPLDGLREALRNAIREMRESGDVRPEMFVDKPVDPDDFIARARKLIGE